MTTTMENKAVSARWIDVFNARDNAGESDVRAASGFIAHAPASLEPKPLDAEGWRGFLDGFVQGFPDLRLTIMDATGDDRLVAQRIHFEGTHTGVFQGLPPTGRTVAFDGLELNLHGDDGRVVEHWFQLDALSLLKQLGLVVIPGPRLLPRILGDALTKLFRRR